MDLTGYDKFMQGHLKEYSLPEKDLKASLESIKGLPRP